MRPANLAKDDYLPHNFAMLGVGRQEMTTEEFRAQIAEDRAYSLKANFLNVRFNYGEAVISSSLIAPVTFTTRGLKVNLR